MQQVKVYAPEMIIVNAELLGFAKVEAAKEKCTHKSCGYVQGVEVCPKCQSVPRPSFTWKNVIPSEPDQPVWTSKAAYCCSKCDTLISYKIVEVDGKKTLKRIRSVYVGGTGPVKCKQTTKFTLLSESELCNPETKARHAVLQTKTYITELRDIRNTIVIIDIENSTCEPGLWAYNGATKAIYKNGDLDTSKIVNIKQMIENMF